MGTEVQCKSYLPRYYPMRDLNEDSNSGSSLSLYYSNEAFPNRQFYNSFLPEICTPNDKDLVKQTMLKHEAIFRRQVSELHRLYRVQKNLMDEIRRDEHEVPLLPSNQWQFSDDSIPIRNGCFSENCGTRALGSSRPLKVRRKMIDLQLPADEYIDDDTEVNDEKVPDSPHIASRNYQNGVCSDMNLFLGSGENAMNFPNSSVRRTVGFGDLNNPINVEETSDSASVDFFRRAEFQNQEKISSKPISQLLGFPRKFSNGIENRFMNRHQISMGSECLPYESGRSSKPVSLAHLHQQELLKLNPRSVAMITRNIELSSPLSNDYERYNCREKVFYGLQNSVHNLHQLNTSSPFVPPDLGIPSFYSGFSPDGQSIRPGLNHLAQSRGLIYGDNARFDTSCSESIQNCRNRNRFYHGSCSSGSKDPVLNNAKHANHIRESAFAEMNQKKEDAALEINMGSSSSSNGAAVVKGGVEVAFNGGIASSALPWLTNNKVKIIPKTESEIPIKKIMGVPIFQKPHVSVNESSLSVSSPHEVVVAINLDKRKDVPDINLVSDDPNENMHHIDHIDRIDRIDLNSSIHEEEEDPLISSVHLISTTDIDLETPEMATTILPWKTSEESKIEKPMKSRHVEEEEEREDSLIKDGAIISAAEAMVAISSYHSRNSPLLLFAEVACRCGEEKKTMDYFEFMTLKLRESKGGVRERTPTGPEKNDPDARRGRRQRRDFRRDILPGIVSLSRHEITEDLQAFGGSMKARPCRRSCRKPAGYGAPAGGVAGTPAGGVVELGLMEGRLRGWGKKTRRPRLKRCFRGNINNNNNIINNNNNNNNSININDDECVIMSNNPQLVRV